MSETIFHPAVLEMRGADIAALRDASRVVVENVDWSVSAGEFWVVAGPPQSGKSDLLMTAAGLLLPARGSCRVSGCDTKDFGEAQLAQRLRVGLVFADGKLFNDLSIAENIALPLRYRQDLAVEAVTPAVGTLLELLELKPFANVLPANIPANWRNRAALARALALKPELLLLDNPLAGLGARHRQLLLDFLEQLARGHEFFGGQPLTMVATTDDLSAWRHPRRKFAALHEGNFSVLGAWDDGSFSKNAAVKDLLSAPVATTI
jgi:phospholipid/cholesterol/gamma-HCH transport system ATP-binding protein